MKNYLGKSPPKLGPSPRLRNILVQYGALMRASTAKHQKVYALVNETSLVQKR